jgi:RNA recognition motif. (a.k.a. RRM, RBD, or RNP domain)
MDAHRVVPVTDLQCTGERKGGLGDGRSLRVSANVTGDSTSGPPLHITITADMGLSLLTEKRRCIFVDYLTPGVTEGILRELFSRSGGKVLHVEIQRENSSSLELSIRAFLTMSTEAEALETMKDLQGYWLKGAAIKIRVGLCGGHHAAFIIGGAAANFE